MKQRINWTINSTHTKQIEIHNIHYHHHERMHFVERFCCANLALIFSCSPPTLPTMSENPSAAVRQAISFLPAHPQQTQSCTYHNHGDLLFTSGGSLQLRPQWGLMFLLCLLLEYPLLQTKQQPLAICHHHYSHLTCVAITLKLKLINYMHYTVKTSKREKICEKDTITFHSTLHMALQYVFPHQLSCFIC